MAKTFELKANLPEATRKEIDRIQAIDSGLRTTEEAAFLTSLAPYLTNEVLLLDDDANIVIATGQTLPTDYEGFAKPSFFLKTDAGDGESGLYENIGTTSDADWEAVGQADTIESGTPVNAVASAQTLTLTGVITPGTHASSLVTASTIVDGDTLTIGSTVYRFKTTPAQAYDVNLGANDAEALDNLKLAINANGTGDGSDYYTGTDAHPDVVATTNTATTQTVIAKEIGTDANSIATTSTGGTLTWEDTTLGGGTGSSVAGVAPETVTIDSVVYSFVDALTEDHTDAVVNQVLFGANSAAALDNLKLAINAGAGEGTNYSTGTTEHSTVEATTNTDTTQVVAAKTKGTSGDSIAVADTITNGDWGEANLENGVDGTVASAQKLLVDSSYLYVAIAANTVADANWRRISVGSVF